MIDVRQTALPGHDDAAGGHRLGCAAVVVGGLLDIQRQRWRRLLGAGLAFKK